MSGLQIKPLDKQVDKTIPSTIPKIPFSHYIVGGKGAGKTTLLLNLLLKKEFYKHAFHKVYWISPTNKLDEKLAKLKEADVTIANVPLWKELKKSAEILDDPIEIPKQPTASPVELLDSLQLEWLQELIKAQRYVIENNSKSISNKVLLILDDSISSKVLKTPVFRNFLLNSRHYNISTIFVSQSYMLLDRAIRINNSFLSVFEVSNTTNLRQIYEENPAGLDFKSWLEVYSLCVSEDFGFLSISYQNEKAYRLIKNFEEFLMIEDDKE